MFRARFNDVFPRSTPHFGPQDVERGVADPTPGDHIERLLCAFLGLVLNRKKDVEYERHLPPSSSRPRMVGETIAVSPVTMAYSYIIPTES